MNDKETINNLEWNVFIGDFNSGEIQTYNVFRHSRFVGDISEEYVALKKEYKEKPEDELKAVFAETVKHNLMYYFWSKCEWEVIVSHWPPCERFKDKKIDVRDQIELNWDKFFEYVWQNRQKLVYIAKEYKRRKY